MSEARYAVNLAALMGVGRETQHMPIYMLLRGIVTEEVVFPFGTSKIGHEALAVRGDVSDERWQAITTLIRKKLRYAEFPLYARSNGRWKTIR